MAPDLITTRETGPIPDCLMPDADTVPVDIGPVDYLTESIHRHLLGGDMARERVTCPLATTQELQAVSCE